MLGQCLRRWLSVGPAVSKHCVSAELGEYTSGNKEVPVVLLQRTKELAGGMPSDLLWLCQDNFFFWLQQAKVTLAIINDEVLPRRYLNSDPVKFKLY